MEENPYQSTITPELKSDDDDDDEKDAHISSSRSMSATITNAMLENVEKDKNSGTENKKVERVVELFKRKNEQPNLSEQTGEDHTEDIIEQPKEVNGSSETDAHTNLDNIKPIEIMTLEPASTIETVVPDSESTRNAETTQSTRERVESGFRSDYVFEPETNQLHEGNRYRGEVIIEREINLTEPSETEIDLRAMVSSQANPERVQFQTEQSISNTTEQDREPSEPTRYPEATVSTELGLTTDNSEVDENTPPENIATTILEHPRSNEVPTWYGPNVQSINGETQSDSAVMPEAAIVEVANDAARLSREKNGLLADSTIGNSYEQLKQRRREKKIAKAHAKELRAREKNIISEHVNTLTETSDGTTYEQQTELPVQPVLGQEQLAVPQHSSSELSYKNRRFAKLSSARNQQRPLATATAMERIRGAQAEKGFTARLDKLLPKRAESKPIATLKQGDEQLRVPAEHRLQTSAWHAIEIDTKTGKPVENGTFEYGQEYYRERAHEVSEPNDTRDTAAGEVALVAAAMANNTQSQERMTEASISTSPDRSDHTRPDGQKKSATAMKDRAISAKDKTTKAIKHSLTDSGPLWPYILAFGVVLVLVILAFN